jgi:hypothetical protein
MKTIFAFLITIFLLIAVAISAVAQQPCPASVALSLSRSGSACQGIVRNQACYGNGMINATFFDDGHMDTPGSTIAISGLQRLETQIIDDGLSVALMRVQSDLSEGEQRSATFLIYGSVGIENHIPPMATFIVNARGTVNIRDFPDITGEIVKRLGLGEQATVNGRTAEGSWMRVRIPNSEALGWIPAEVASSGDPINALDVVGDATTIQRTFQSFSVETGRDDTLCDGAPESGVLIQTPNVFRSVQFIINGVETHVSATLLLQTGDDDDLNIYVLDGEIEVDGIFIPAGARTSLSHPAPQPYSADDVTALPINSLPSRIQITAPMTEDELMAVIARHNAVIEAKAEATENPTPIACRYTVRRLANLWGGPGRFYEAVNEIREGADVHPVLATRDPDGEVWWQLNNSNWIRAEVVDAAPTCGEIPFMARVPYPTYNTLKLEDCMTANGPLRAGQQVRIEFTPPAFDGYEEALAATRIDPGRVIVNERYLYVSADAPVLRGGTSNRYFRVFYAEWTPQPGTYRIVGDRITYELICNLTVPVGS